MQWSIVASLSRLSLKSRRVECRLSSFGCDPGENRLEPLEDIGVHLLDGLGRVDLCVFRKERVRIASEEGPARERTSTTLPAFL